MDGQLKRGLLDVCVLAAIKSEDSCGYKIIKDIKPYMELSESTLYTILKRLETANMLNVRTAEHGGRLRKYYHITGEGLKRIEDFKVEWKEISQAGLPGYRDRAGGKRPAVYAHGASIAAQRRCDHTKSPAKAVLFTQLWRENVLQLREYDLNQQHVAGGAAGDGEHGVALPQVEQHHHGAGDQLRQGVSRMNEIDRFQAVDHQHAHDGKGEYLAQIGDEGRRLFFAAEYPKGEKA